MRPTRRLDVLLVPDRLECPVEAGHALLTRLRDEGVLDPEGLPGPNGARWMAAGFGRVTVDDPGRAVLYANRQGGFSVACPVQGTTSVLPAFSAALTAWRADHAGTDPSFVCPVCGGQHRLDAVAARPPIALGRFAVVTAFAEAADLAEEAMTLAKAALGPIRVVLRRG